MGDYTISKPTGTASGDLLVALLSGTDAVVTPASGWTLIRNSAGGPGELNSYYKIAGGSETANYTWTTDGSGSGNVGGVILRISGFSANEPINSSASGAQSNTATPSIAGAAVTPSYAESLFIMWWGQTNDETNDPKYSDEAIATSNPSWTEQQESSSATTLGFVCATATRPEITATGAVSATSTGGADADHSVQMIVINPIQNATATPSSIAVTATVQTPTISVGVSITVSAITVTATVNTPSTSTYLTWTPETKSSTVTFTPTDKTG